jgi:hypothetical protein
MRFTAIALSLAALAACRAAVDPAGTPDASQVTNDTLVLAPGQEVRVGGVFRVAFLEVSSDSRCPSDVLCVWAGNAAVEIGLAVGMGPTHPFTLNTLAYPPASVDYAGYRVTLVDLTPYPISTRRIPPEEYRAHLLVGRMSNVQ